MSAFSLVPFPLSPPELCPGLVSWLIRALFYRVPHLPAILLTGPCVVPHRGERPHASFTRGLQSSPVGETEEGLFPGRKRSSERRSDRPDHTELGGRVGAAARLLTSSRFSRPPPDASSLPGKCPPPAPPGLPSGRCCLCRRLSWLRERCHHQP